MYRCDHCDAEFNEPDRNESWDAYDAHGYVSVSYFEIEVCPSCGSEAFEVDDEGFSGELGTAAEDGGVMSEETGAHYRPFSIDITIPPLGMLIFKPTH